MNFVIITHVPHILDYNFYYAYAPYVREMNIWTKYVDTVTLVAPKSNDKQTAIDFPYEHKNITFIAIDSFDVLQLKAVIRTLFKIPKLFWTLYKAMKNADHIHLRCPGNIGLLGCFVQVLFPSKMKTAKYAGNWDPKSKQPFTYKLQKWILANSFLTRNMQVLVYGEWEGSSGNIKPFFTATYQESDKTILVPKDVKSPIRFVFVGTLVNGKNPLYAIQIVELLSQRGYDVSLDLYGEGIEKTQLEQYCIQNQLTVTILFHGNQTKEIVKAAYQRSHFVILPSESEGWPKAIAEGMFWGCVPIATAVSCVPYMLDYGNRGILLALDSKYAINNNLDSDAEQIELLLQNEILFKKMSKNASTWSRKYTLDVFESAIKNRLT